MSSSIDFYVFGQCESAVVSAATSEATGYPKENLLDFNPDTIWKGTSTATQYIKIDLGSAKSIGAYCFFVKNYPSITSGNVLISWADTDLALGDGGWTPVTMVGQNLVGSAGPLRHRYMSSPISHRYWQLTIAGQDVVVELSGLWVGLKYTLTIGNEWPENDREIYHNQAVELAGGREHIVAINRKKQFIIPREYRLPSSASFQTLQSVYNDCRGRRYPLVIQEGDSYDDLRLVRFAEDALDKNEESYLYYHPRVTFVELPYIDAGDSY